MLPPSWQLKTPLEAVIFDCDGTLSSIEGIDELAEKNGVGTTVRHLTAEAMGKTGINFQLYQDRLELVAPTQTQVQALGLQYIQNLTKDTDLVIQLLQRLKKKIYIISAGLFPAVNSLAKFLKIPSKHIFAVDIQFDNQGNYIQFETTSPLVTPDGKRQIVADLIPSHAKIAYVGDGLNDLAVYDLVTRFIGYGGVYYRENIKSRCEYYIEKSSMTSLLPLILTSDEYLLLTEEERTIYHLGLGH